MNKGYTIDVLDKGYVRYIDHMGSDRRIVESARVSYGSSNKTEEEDKKLLTYLYKNKHTSPFEMCKITLDFKMPIFIQRQYIRHRMQNVNEFSMRYKEAPEEFYIPSEWRSNLKLGQNKQQSIENKELDHEYLSAMLSEHCKTSYSIYTKLIQLGVAREMARIVLPLNIYTYFYATWDLKNILHFITLREDAHAQAEIQEYGKAIKQIIIELFPWTMECFAKFKFELKEI